LVAVKVKSKGWYNILGKGEGVGNHAKMEI
jgi:hypothetical protein